ncbi:MAG: Omp28-related outer membrane protein [Chitinophagaceae bacterium]|nr:Omp28-related outer membrane protein [Chitinophagaceae bacterium]
MLKWLSIFCSCLFVVSCSDRQPVIVVQEDPLKIHPVRYRQNVLVEGLQAEWLESSIQAAADAEKLRQQYPGRVSVAQFHVQDWLETPLSEQLISFLGGTIGYPKAALNRLPGEQTELQEDGFIWLSPLNWQAAVQRQVIHEAPLAMALEHQVLSNHSSQLIIHIAHKQAFNENLRLVVYAVEDSVKNIFQQGATGSYFHPSVFKNCLTAFEGDTIQLHEEFPEGNIRIKTLENLDLSQFNKSLLRLIVFIYSEDASYKKRKVLNVQEVRFGGIRYWDI